MDRKSKIDESDRDAVRRIATTAIGSQSGAEAINAAFAELCAKHTQAVALQIICQVVFRETRRSSLVAEAFLAALLMPPDDGPEDSQEPSSLH